MFFQSFVPGEPGRVVVPSANPEPVKDQQTVTPEGALVKPLIDGVRIRPATTQIDDRGELCEMYDPRWGFTAEPMVYAYMTTVQPGVVKGWVVHRLQDDRLFMCTGAMKTVLYDDRPESRTYRMVNEIHLGERNRGLLRIPLGVYHAVQNVGTTEAMFMNFPTRPYDHKSPDKYRLPLDTDRIPYQFKEVKRW